MTGLILFGSFAVLLILGVPIAMSLGAAGMATILFSPDVHLSLNVIAQRIFGGLDSTSSCAKLLLFSKPQLMALKKFYALFLYVFSTVSILV